MGNTHTMTRTEYHDGLTHTSTGTESSNFHGHLRTHTGTETETHLGNTWTHTGTESANGHSHTSTATETSTPHTHTFTGTESSTLLQMLAHHHHTATNAVPAKGCVAISASNIVCNTKQMSLPTCPPPGSNVAKPAGGCRPQRLLVVML